MSDSDRFDNIDGIAIIGMSCRFPGAKNVDEFWQNLRNGTESISLFSDQELKSTGVDLAALSDPAYVKAGFVLEDIELFDASFFNYSPGEAEIIDPQQRLFLECAWEALENSGYDSMSNEGPIGVYAGGSINTYLKNFVPRPELDKSLEVFQALIGNDKDYLASRVSYKLNLTGPSVTIQTACSSSLVAVHMACESLRNLECDMALAGGVRISIPQRVGYYYQEGMVFSPDGHCRAFDAKARGTAFSNGVGIVVLKRLVNALEDGDYIHAVIKGSAINNDGSFKVGFTAPSGKGQESVITESLAVADIEPETVTYIEAHGTGTELGDPIEIKSLKQVFRSTTKKKGFCAIGSVKTNIGHLEQAAGVASLIKTVLALKHKLLPPSLNFEHPNPKIDFENSPFYVNTKLSKWQSDNTARRAGVSSFGIGGTNAHVIVEEFKESRTKTLSYNSKIDSTETILLSARNEERLKEYAKSLISHLKIITKENEYKLDGQQDNILDDSVDKPTLQDIAYTLQVGRQDFEERLAVIVKSKEELIQKLDEYINNKENIEGLYRGNINTNKNKECKIGQSKEEKEFIIQLFNAQKISKIVAFWVSGSEIDWRGIYKNKDCRRVPLPTYPFARERCWLENTEFGVQSAGGGRVGLEVIHPLLHLNTSDLSGQRFSSTFTGQEFFLVDHVVRGHRVLPGVACLEMARVAVKQAAGVLEEGQVGILLKNVVWARPVTVGGQPFQVHIGLYPEENGEITYEIYSQSGAADAMPVIYSQGTAVFSAVKETPKLDLKVLQAECSQRSLSASQCYEAFRSMGMDYGPGHQGIEEVFVGSDSVLAKLSLPISVLDTQEQFVLHPSLIDSALQASIGLMIDTDDLVGAFLADVRDSSLKPTLPFALQELEILDSCTSAMWALLRPSEDTVIGNKAQKLDIDLCDDNGVICVRMKGFSLRVLTGEISDGGTHSIGPGHTTATVGTLILKPCWKEQTVPEEATAPALSEHLVILCEMGDSLKASIETQINGVRCLALQSKQKGIEERFQSYAVIVFEEIKRIISAKHKVNVLVQIVFTIQEEQQLFSGLSGLLRTARLENPTIIGQLVGVSPREVCEGIIEKLKENSRRHVDKQICYQGGKRLVATWGEVEAFPGEKVPWKDHGIYLITGGVGGLGIIFAREIIQKVKDATLVLTGRSPLDEDKQARLKALEVSGARIEYKQVDVTQKNAVAGLIQRIREDFGNLHGIIHSAGVIRNNFILKKTSDELQVVLAPKVTGLTNLDRASKNLPLDFFICFSSGVGVMGNPGQADYATANAFMDAYAKYRNHLVASKQRHGLTLSINWPLWKEGGMQVDETTEKMMKQSIGLIAMDTRVGVQALYQGLASGLSQVMVMEGELERLRATLLDQSFRTEDSETLEENKSVPAIEQELLQEKTANYLVNLLSSVIKLPAHRFEMEAPMEKYGIDSIMVMKLTIQLEKTFGSLSKTLFFEYQNIKELSRYFVESYPAKLAALLGMEGNSETATTKYNDSVTENNSVTSALTTRRRPRFASIRAPSHEEKATNALDIAIIGLSGRYPGARNINEFWKNLRDGKDCITEVPKDRWDHNLYFDEDKNKSGKTYSKWGGFLEGVDQFDPLFFNISPREAEIMDPQERLFLECVFETLEDAGYTREALGMYKSFGLRGNVGIYAGVMYEEYQLYGAEATIQGRPIALSGIPSSIANRVSYFCNFHGPSMAVDTMCSSSLTTIHLACQSLKQGDCQFAIAGGVNLSIHPNKYLLLGQSKFASSKGKCESFGQGGDGYVPGEGVGAVLLKPLSKAIADRDHIYGVIKATAINHGGKTNGYSVPNPNAQASVIGRAFKEAGIDPRTVSYMEAHGTGTSLGDPIEITGLNKAFQEYTQDKQFCAIGSAKSNIGHCESAAGICGVTKVLLQLKHRKLVPSLHSEVLNPNIDFESTPFIVQQKLAEWERPVVWTNGEAREYPRRAGISSFGAGGANAHVVVEEYVPENQEQPQIMISSQDSFIIVLSAKNEDRLNEQVVQLLAAIREQQFSDHHLVEIAYTLQVGREAMEERLAVIVGTVKELEEKLEGFIDGKEGIEYMYRGQVKRNKETLAVFEADGELQEAINKWVQRGKLSKLSDLWVKGLNFDWNKLYGDVKPNRISLPTYPFVRERYWVPETRGERSMARGEEIQRLHPLLHQNTSDFSEQRFSSTFTGQEFFLEDHVVKGRRVLPGVAYLEMARAAVTRAAGNLGEGQMVVRLKDVVWARPVTVGEQPVHVHIGLFPEEDGMVAYEIYSVPENGDEAPVVHSKGKVVLPFEGIHPERNRTTQNKNSAAAVTTLDLNSLRAECSQRTLSSSQCYKTFRAMGIDYGPGHQGIEVVYVGHNKVLAKLFLPSEVSDTADQFVLHPSLMDCALQASIGLMNGPGNSPGIKDSLKLALPFALKELEIFSSCTSTMWALIRYSDGSATGDKVQKLYIDLCDEAGKVCVRMKEFSSRVLEGDFQTNDVSKAASTETYTGPLVGSIMLTPVWDVVSVEKGQAFLSSTDKVVIVGGNKKNRSAIRQYCPQARLLEIHFKDSIDTIAKKLAVYSTIDHILWIAPHNSLESLTEETLIEEQGQGVLLCFRMVKALLLAGYGTKDLGCSFFTIQTQPVHKNDLVDPAHASIHGLIGSMAKEYPNWKVRLFDLEGGCNWPLTDIFSLPADPQGNAWIYRGGEWYRQQLISFHCDSLDQTLYKSGGVYVVVGGAGGIGEAWSEYMIRTYQARVIWIGRRQKDATIQSKLDKLAVLGPVPHYIAADATDLKALQQAYGEIKQRFSQIHGVIHSAIVLLDQSLANMEEERFQAGLSAKVDVSVRIAQVFQKEPLDFVLFFSSMIGFLKNPGQSNYASGCTFKDAFAHQLSRKWPCAVKIINWGYWGSIGIVASKVYHDRMAREGIGSIEPPEAMEALETLLAGPVDQIALLKTLGPLVMEGMNPEEHITLYPEKLLSNIQNMQKPIPKQDVQVQQIKSKVTLQTKEMDTLLSRLLWAQLLSTGLFEQKNSPIADLNTKGGMRDFYNRWLEESIAILARKNYLKLDRESCTVVDTTPMDVNAVWTEWDLKKGLWIDDPNMKAMAVLVEATLRALPEILTGKRLATDILFPNSSMELVEGIYKYNPVADYFNGALADIAVTYIQERLRQDSSAQIRILEIGAGTGGTSTMIFPKLQFFKEHIQEYCYTDISKAFLMYAEKEYGQKNPYLAYKIFDVEAPIAKQDISAGGYDIAVATNVLHATKNIRQTLRNAKAALKTNGLLLLNELSRNTLFSHLTFGLLEGWWLYEDPMLRIPGCPVLSSESWQSVLESEGFQSVMFPAREKHDLGQQIIIAESDGVVRQKRPLKLRETPVKQPSITQNKHLNLQKTKVLSKGADVTGQMIEDHVRMVIRESIAKALKMEEGQIQDDQSFAEYGVDSIIAVNLVNLISKRCNITLQTTILFDYNNVDQLLQYITQKHESTLTLFLQENVPVLEEADVGSQREEITVAQEKRHTSHRFNRKWQRNRFSPFDPSDREVQILVKSLSLNSGDIHVKDLYPDNNMPDYPLTTGFGISGTVIKTGRDVTRVKTKDAVIGLTSKILDGQSSIANVDEGMVIKKPENITFEEACTLPVDFLSIYYAFEHTEIQPGEKILILTSSVNTGLMAVHLALLKEADIYISVDSQEKLDYLKDMGVKHLINYSEDDFEKGILELTGNSKVDTIISSFEKVSTNIMNVLVDDGKFVEIK
ncbi:beta-ketoacyl synthase [Candidatus Scalindua japonica]|uniref:Beta-ketoacyl synthase n=1 Tax=Candidatus Scalindua japonica TaxID=1284222 RepID=A0A286TWJ7_9BACT|nr:SDR family NAD(P)-dependent oxidoreductase [Candidatus Scalindua japonica]GAX60250.1 beta-ketoacyl synthase [Candidatus Scalindua japonica]